MSRYLQATEASVRALGWDGIVFTQRTDGTWVATAVKDVRYGVGLPTGRGATPERAAENLLRDPKLRPQS